MGICVCVCVYMFLYIHIDNLNSVWTLKKSYEWGWGAVNNFFFSFCDFLHIYYYTSID